LLIKNLNSKFYVLKLLTTNGKSVRLFYDGENEVCI